MSPAVAAFNRIDGIGPDDSRFACRIAIDPNGRLEQGDQFHRIVGGISDAAEVGRDFRPIAVGGKCPPSLSGIRFITTVREDVKAAFSTRYPCCIPRGAERVRIVVRTGAAGFQRSTLLDPDGNVIEVNTAR